MNTFFGRYGLLGLLGALLLAGGCRNPVKRPPKNVFRGTPEYVERLGTLNITEEQAFMRARDLAAQDERERGVARVQYVSRYPVFIHSKTYVFTIPQPQNGGAGLMGYHVDGVTGRARFYTGDTFIRQTRR